MKKVVASLFLINSLFAQEVGSSAVQSSETARWQNWAFAGSALVTAGIGIFVAALSQGSTHSH